MDMSMPESHDKFQDPFAPPKVPCVVCCIHCGSTYDSWRIAWREMPGEAISGAWCCPIPGCDGVGFRFDIHPVDPDWEKQFGVSPLDADIELEDEDGEAWSDDADEEEIESDFDVDADMGFELPIDEFDEAAYWIPPSRIVRRQLGNTPQPPYDRAPWGPGSAPYLPSKDDDIPF